MRPDLAVSGVLRVLADRQAVVEDKCVDLRLRLGFLEEELATLRPAVRELRGYVNSELGIEEDVNA